MLSGLSEENNSDGRRLNRSGLLTGMQPYSAMVQALPDEVPAPGSSGSIRITSKPLRCSHRAQLRPTTPAPTTAIRVLEFKRILDQTVVLRPLVYLILN
jgi:hypothetical protein